MKTTIELPDDLYRRVKAKSALVGRPVREVTEELYRRWLDEEASTSASSEDAASFLGERSVPSWFGVLRAYSRAVASHDMESIRASIAHGLAGERQL